MLYVLIGPCVMFGLGIYLLSYYIYLSKSYECVNTVSINDIEYYNTEDRYKFVDKIVKFM